VTFIGFLRPHLLAKAKILSSASQSNMASAPNPIPNPPGRIAAIPQQSKAFGIQVVAS